MYTKMKFGFISAAAFLLFVVALPSHVFATGSGQPTVTITSPTGGENLVVGQTYHITWNASSNVDKVSVGYSFGEGSLNWFANNAANNISNTNSYDWTVNIGNHTLPAQVRIYVIAYNTGTGSAYTYSNYFTVSSPATVPTLASYAATNITQTSATLSGAVNTDGGSAITSQSFVYGGYSSGTVAPTSPLSTSPSANLTGLSCGQTYTYHLQATNAVGTANSTDQTFITSSCATTNTNTTTTVTLPTVVTLPYDNSHLGGNVTSLGGASSVSIGFQYGTTTAYGGTMPFWVPLTAAGGWTDNIAEMCATTYHYRAFATNSAGTAYGADMSFTAFPCSTTTNTNTNTVTATEKTYTIISGGKTRSYLVHIPAGTDTATKRSLLIAFHGAGDTARGFSDWTKFSTVADTYNYITVYPESYISSWADGRGMAPEDAQGINDVQFVRDMVKDVVSKFAVDTAHVYATGFSSGGYFSHKLACETTDIFKAFAPVGAGFPDTLTGNCSPQTTRSLIFIEGSEDAGNGTTTSGVKIFSAETTMSKWTAINGCTDTAPLSGGTIQSATHMVCKNGTRVAERIIQGAGHTWVRQPGFDTSAVIMEFFHQENNVIVGSGTTNTTVSGTTGTSYVSGCTSTSGYSSTTGMSCAGTTNATTNGSTTTGTTLITNNTTINVNGTNTSTNGTVGVGSRANLARLVLIKSLRYGQTDPEVKNLQSYLLARGYLSGTATGYYGAMTRAGVKKLQSDLGIVSDGSNVGPATRAALSSLK